MRRNLRHQLTLPAFLTPRNGSSVEFPAIIIASSNLSEEVVSHSAADDAFCVLLEMDLTRRGSPADAELPRGGCNLESSPTSDRSAFAIDIRTHCGFIRSNTRVLPVHQYSIKLTGKYAIHVTRFFRL